VTEPQKLYNNPQNLIARISAALPREHPCQEDLRKLRAPFRAFPGKPPEDVDFRESLYTAVEKLRDWERGMVTGTELMDLVRHFEWELGFRDKK